MQVLPKILCVDDEPNVLDSFRRQLRDDFDLEVTTSPMKALDLIKNGRKFSVVVSDMRMPSMDGVEFLKNVQKLSPLTVRIMLTGNADQETAAKAVNEGQIFRFVNKPCSSTDLKNILGSASQQFSLLSAEKDLLQNTLSGSIKVLSEILAMVDPVGFGAAAALREPVREITKTLQLKNAWEIDLAAMLHPIGWITVPESVRAKFRAGDELTLEEKRMVDRVPELGSQFIGSIPRLEGVGRIIFHSGVGSTEGENIRSGPGQEQIPEGARVLRIARELIESQRQGLSKVDALGKLRERTLEFDATLLDRLIDSPESADAGAATIESFPIQPSQLCPGQRLTENLFCADGRLLLGVGTYLSELMCKRILNYAQSGNLALPIMVDSKIPKADKSEGGKD